MEIEKINKAATILYSARINLERVKELPKDRSISVLIQRRDGPVFLALKLDK